jgi:hypothetical protein
MATTAKRKRDSIGKPPTAGELAKLLGDALPAFKALVRRRDGRTCEWRRYIAKTPWVMKVSCGDRTLYYAKPLPDSVEVTVVLGDRAAEAALAGAVSKHLHESIRTAKRYPEGRPVRVMVKSKTDLAAVEELVAVKLKPTR